jgi:hypothetical protein
MIDAMRAALKELEDVLECINQDKIPFDGDDFHETLRNLRQAIAEAEKQEKLCKYCGGIGRVACDGRCMPKQEPVALQAVYETIIQWDEAGGKRSRRELARRIVDRYTAPMSTKPENIDTKSGCVDRVDIDLLRQSEREGWRYAKECEAEIERLKVIIYEFEGDDPPKPWVGLTDEEEIELDEKYGDDFNAYIDARDAKLKEKNT